MKIHITNLYGIKNEMASLQHKVAYAARMLVFFELGIYRYPVETDSLDELRKRLDGIIAAVEPSDVVGVQLPTGNGIEFERLLLMKLRGIKNVRIVLFMHDSTPYDSLEPLGPVSRVVYPTESMQKDMKAKGLVATLWNRMSFDTDDSFMLRKNLLEAADFYDEVMDEKACNEDEFIQVAFGLYDKSGHYTKYVGTVIQSILENTQSKVCFHIFHDETLTEYNRLKLLETAGRFGSYIQFHKLNAEDFMSENKWVSYYTIGAMFRLIMPRVLKNHKKIIYLDADLLFHRDIKELWNIDISNYSLAAKKDIIFDNGIHLPKFIQEGHVSKDRYFNSGVLLMNLEKIREKGDLLEMTHEFLRKYPRTSLPDQDALNYYLNSSTLLLDESWNVPTQYEKQKTVKISENVVYHFMGQPFIDFYNTSEFEKYYMSMKERTAWGYDAIESEFLNGFRNLSDKIENSQGAMAAIAQGKKKIFYGYYNTPMQNLFALLHLNENDYFVHPDSSYIGKKLGGLKCHSFEDIKTEEKGTFIVFALPEIEDGKAIPKLKELGLEEGKDFFCIPKILINTQGGYWA